MRQPSPQPEWFDLKMLSAYACASEKTLRTWIRAATDPLPASQRGNKIYVRRSEFDIWMERQAVRNNTSVEIARVVDDIINEVVGSRIG